MAWDSALEVFASVVDDQLCWMLVGSAATRLQGAEVDPGDVDILVHPDTSDDEMYNLARALQPWATSGSVSQELDSFLSTGEQPLAATADWLFGRWLVDGCKLEVARIRVDIGPAEVVETLGTAVWAVRRRVSWRGLTVPVVPLEVQLKTLGARGLDERAQAVRRRLA